MVGNGDGHYENGINDAAGKECRLDEEEFNDHNGEDDYGDFDDKVEVEEEEEGGCALYQLGVMCLLPLMSLLLWCYLYTSALSAPPAKNSRQVHLSLFLDIDMLLYVCIAING